MIDARVLARALDRAPREWQPKEGLRDAAVLVPWFTRSGNDYLLYTERRHDLPHHPGQISFPGGAREGDESPIECALRETEEEVGLPPDECEVLGGLPPRWSIAGFWVHVVVARVPAPTWLRPDPGEVARVLEVPLAELVDSSRWDWRPPTGFPGRGATPHFDHAGAVIWGLTGRFTLDLVERVSG